MDNGSGMVVPGLVLQGRYRLDGRIAAGGMGDVWRGTDLALGRPVAVKLLRPGSSSVEEGLARFRAEARHAGLLSHPNIAHVYDYREPLPPEPGCLVMELVDGPSLARVLDEGPIDAARTLDIIAQAAAGLAAAHAAGLVHRDIKPGNLLVSRTGQVKITDFGIAHGAASLLVTGTGILLGTPAYLAPERATGGLATPAADLYALGIVAYHCLTGQVPFEGEPLAVALAHVQKGLPPLPPSVPPAVRALITALTAKDPRDRPASAADVVAWSERLRAGQAGAAALPLAGAAATNPAGAAATDPATSTFPAPGEPLRPEEDSGDIFAGRPRNRTAARAALALVAVAVAGLGWAAVMLTGSTPPPRPLSPAHTAAEQPGPHRTAASRPVAVTHPVSTRTGGPRASHTPHAHGHPSRSATPTPTPTLPSPPPPSESPTPTAPPPTPSPTPSPAPSPTSAPEGSRRAPGPAG